MLKLGYTIEERKDKTVPRRRFVITMDHWNVRNGTDPLRILGAESYLDGSTLEIAQSLTDMAPSEIREGRWNWYVERPTRQLTPPALNARQIEMPKPATAKVKGKKRGRSADVEETQLGKKQKRRASEEEGNEPENKARGRPRLDTKDETAADVCHISLCTSSQIISFFAEDPPDFLLTTRCP